MTYRGHVEDGKVVLDDGVDLPNGTPVEVRPLKARRPAAKKRRKQLPTLYERLAPFAGVIKDMPADSSTNLDHYLYGLPKRK